MRLRALLLTICLSSFAADLNISDTPLFMGNTIEPNIFFQVDDSGSMDWDILTKKHWHSCAYDPTIGGGFSSSTCGFEIDNGLVRGYVNFGYRYFTYVFDNNDNVYSGNCFNSTYNEIENCTSIATTDWRVYSHSLNVTYYNPSQTYEVWSGPCQSNGDVCEDANFFSARGNPRQGESGYNDTRSLVGLEYHVWRDNRGYSGSRPERGTNSNATDTANDEVDLWDDHARIVVNTTTATIESVTYNPNTTGLNESTTLLATLTDTSACYNALGDDDEVLAILTGTQSATSTGADSCRTISQAQDNIANWYQYNRKRSQIAKMAVSMVVENNPSFRYGLNLINSTSTFVEVPDADETDFASHNEDLLDTLFRYNWSANGTPLRQGLQRVGQYFDDTLSGKDDPIIASCQQNFAILMTDGYWSGSNPSSYIGNSDNDSYSRTLADVAHYYYSKDLSPLDDEVVPNPFDPAEYQHMVTFGVAFGVTGNLEDTDGDGWPDPSLTESDNWGNPYSSDPEKVDDLWHASYNSKGTFVNAATPEEFVDSLNSAIGNITSRVASAASAAANTGVLQTGSEVYQAQFDSDTWMGKLLAYPISVYGVVSATPDWDAGCILTGGTCTFPSGTNSGIDPDDRVIITRNFDGSQSGIPFRWPSDYTSYEVRNKVPQYIEGLLEYAPYNANTNQRSQQAANQAWGQDTVDYLRGDRTNEVQNGGSFRERDSILGDIIDSAPQFIGPPNRNYPDDLESSDYSAFKATYANRDDVIYVGANDGMLHAFNADTGSEIMAYVPGVRGITENIAELTQESYTHKYYVDGPVTVADVFINGSWRTVLVGGLGKGGQGIYALDVTDPSSFSEANANNIFMFEFTDEDDDDMGYSYSPIHIVKMNNGKWAAVFANGYNNRENDGERSNQGKATLFIVFLDHSGDSWREGTDYIKITAGPRNPSISNGMSGAYPVDIDADYQVDYIYGGDLHGNIWKFDVTSSNTSSWDVGTADDDIPFFTTSGDTADQPITAEPVVGPHPLGLSRGVMIYFGTGKYLENSDNSSTGQETQTFYAIWDKLDGSLPSINNLLEQKITHEQSEGFDSDGDGVDDVFAEVRGSTRYTIDWNTHHGWKMDLILDGAASNYGERVIFPATLRNDRVIFTTLLPSSSACAFGGDSWLMELDYASGAGLDVTPFDLNNDGVFDENDFITMSTQLPASGVKSTVGIVAPPTVVLSPDKETEYKVLSGATGITTISENPGNPSLGRQNWRQIR